MIFGFDRGGGDRHNAEIEVWDEKSKLHLFSIDPITGKKTKGPDPKKDGKFGALEFPIFS